MKLGDSMAQKQDFPVVFERLKCILQAHSANLTIQTDEPGSYYLNAPYSARYKKDLFFGAALVKKNYVSFYLMAVYMFPDLLDGMSDTLKKRMQGKSCFNFTSIDEETLNELSSLTEKSMDRFRQEQLV